MTGIIMRLWSLAFVTCIGVGTAMSADFDGSKLLICAPVEAMDCVSGEGCKRGFPDDIGAPAFMRVDVEKKVVIGPKQSTPIMFVDKTDEQLLLQGKELSFGWTIALDQQTGKLTATLVDNRGVFVLFGSCTPP